MRRHVLGHVRPGRLPESVGPIFTFRTGFKRLLLLEIANDATYRPILRIYQYND